MLRQRIIATSKLALARPLPRQFPRVISFSTTPFRKAEEPVPDSTPDPRDKQITDLSDKYEKSLQDFKNLQDQSKRELASAKSFAIQRFARDLLESVDNLSRAANIIGSEIKADAERHKPFADLLHELGKAEGQLLGTLGTHGMTVVNPMGERFDPNVHEATFEMAFPGKEPGTVFHVEQKGYLLNGRVLRPAKVGIVREG